MVRYEIKIGSKRAQPRPEIKSPILPDLRVRSLVKHKDFDSHRNANQGRRKCGSERAHDKAPQVNVVALDGSKHGIKKRYAQITNDQNVVFREIVS